MPPAAQSRTACLDMSDAKWRDVQVRLLKSIVKMYGKADHYAVTLTSQIAPGEAGAPGVDIFAKAIAAVKAADVTAVELRLGGGMSGKAYVLLAGDLSLVQAAVAAAKKAVEADGMLDQVAVVPSPSPALRSVI